VKIIRNIKVPTGNICIVEGGKGLLEYVSLGDYGKEKNLKADFLGLSREINGVPHGELMPLSKKWVITVSTQYGCSMGCKFCDVPKVGPGVNATHFDMVGQIRSGLALHPEIKKAERINVHFARMGEPTWNREVLNAAVSMYYYFKGMGWGYHPVISTMMPKRNKGLAQFIEDWIDLKNGLMNGEAGLQISVNTTSESLRKDMFGGNAMELKDISEAMRIIGKHGLLGRKVTLNIALSAAPVDEKVLRKLFLPKYFLIKLTPMHVTDSCRRNGYETRGGYNNYYPYKDVEERLKSVGFDVIVFVPSKEEDESRITCGNAILSDATAPGGRRES